ncbi:hypothetical protein C1646_771924 [Rhizophagus diaphanus]|nr:hypothetical protein C1646_771924 [Rhizophagus diaphanus] [Rhizophagus sp. MUCL 43196]
MSCSKIFLGDFPELTYEVVKYFHNDFSTLYSCILVNRLWCRLVTPLLWENPFSIRTRKYNYLEIYVQYLNDDIKAQLKEYKVINNSLFSNTFFNYSMFLKHLNIHKFVSSFENWLQVIKIPTFEIRFKILNDICTSLFKIFIENEIKLHTLELEIFFPYSDTIYDNIIKLILKNPNFIHNIRNLKYFEREWCNIPVNDNILQIIKSHQNSKKILLSGYIDFNLYHSLLLSKDSNCSNTLNTITFYKAHLMHLTSNIFEQLNVLESVHIIYCYSLNENFPQQINNLTKPFKLKSLFTDGLMSIESIELLLQKSGSYLENFGYKLRNSLMSQRHSELIIKYCKNLKFLDFHGYESQITYRIFNLIENIIRQNLNYLSINIGKDCYSNIEGSSIILQNLGQVLPSKLEYLSLTLTIIRSRFRVFLQNSQNTFINKLLIMHTGSDDILHYTKEFNMNEKRVKYLAIRNSYNNVDLYDLRDVVKEFKLHNIKVRSFYDLNLSVRYIFPRDSLNSNLIDYLKG